MTSHHSLNQSWEESWKTFSWSALDHGLGCDGISMKAKTLRGDGSETHFSIDDLSESSLLTVTNNISVHNSTPPIHASKSRGFREFSALLIDSISIWALKRIVNSLLHCEFLEWLK